MSNPISFMRFDDTISRIRNPSRKYFQVDDSTYYSVLSDNKLRSAGLRDVSFCKNWLYFYIDSNLFIFWSGLMYSALLVVTLNSETRSLWPLAKGNFFISNRSYSSNVCILLYFFIVVDQPGISLAQILFATR